MIAPTRNRAPTVEPDRLLLRPQEAAAALGVSLRSLMAWVAAGQVPTVRLGDRCLRLPVDGLRVWVAARTTWPTQSGREPLDATNGLAEPGET